MPDQPSLSKVTTTESTLPNPFAIVTDTSLSALVYLTAALRSYTQTLCITEGHDMFDKPDLVVG